MNNKQEIISSAIIIILLGIGLILNIQYQGWIIDSLRIVTGSIGLLFLPGYRLTKAWFKHDDIDILETIALSFAFSISIIPLVVFYLNILGLAITSWLVYGVVIITMLTGIIRYTIISKKHNYPIIS